MEPSDHDGGLTSKKERRKKGRKAGWKSFRPSCSSEESLSGLSRAVEPRLPI